MAARLIDSLWVASYGSALASGSVRFYAVGTTTPVNVFQDDAATVVVTQPVSLDANGRTTVPIYTITPMRAILFNSSGAQVADIERIDGDRAELVAIDNTGWPGASSMDAALTLLRTSFGATNGQVAVTGSGAIARSLQAKLSEQRSVDDFGALGNGIHDDYPEITAAITAVAAAGGGDLLIPPGTYLVSQTVVLQSGVSLRGAGAAYSIIKNSSTTGDCISATQVNSFYIDGIAIQASTASTGRGIFLNSCNTVTVSRVNITGHRYGIDSSDAANAAANPSQEHRYRDCKLIVVDNAAARSIRMTSANASSNGGRHIIDACNVATSGGNAATGIEITGTLNQICVLANYTFGDTPATGVLINSAHTGTGLVFVGNNFSSLTTGLTISRTAGAAGFLVDVGNLWGAQITNSSDNVGVLLASTYSSSMPIRPLGNFSYTQAIGTSTSAVVDLSRGNVIHISATAGGITVTIPAPATAPANPGHTITFMCDNNSGGAVTWTFNAAYVLSAAVNPTSPERVCVTVTYHAGSYYETGRATCPS